MKHSILSLYQNNMKCNMLYFRFFSGTIKSVLSKKYDKIYVKQIIKKSKKIYKDLVHNADDLGKGNPMAHGEFFTLVFIAPYIASKKAIPPVIIQETIHKALKKMKRIFSLINFNTKTGRYLSKKMVAKYIKRYAPEKEKKYPTSFKIKLENYPKAHYYEITRCPICIYCNKLGIKEIMPLLCELDYIIINMRHGILHRKNTIANGGKCCDYLITWEK